VIGSATHGTFSFSSNSATDTSQEPASIVTTPPTSTQLAWIPTYTFSGNGTQKTDPFTIGNDWHIVWSCDPASLHGQDYLVIIEVDAPDGHIVDSGVNTMCTQKHKQDVYKVHVTGRVYLHIITLGDWSVQVEELTEAGIFERVGSHT
jgi:hypothetical protein